MNEVDGAQQRNSLSASASQVRQLDRAIGAVLTSAAGDALGSQYEFGQARADSEPISFGVGRFGHDLGEWTDDTAMAMPILEALARGDSLNDSAVLGQIVKDWYGWLQSAKDVGVQTRGVLNALGGDFSESRARDVARDFHERAGKSAGNGSLMRTGPVALGYLADGAEPDLVDAAGRIAQLTHWEQDNVDACVLWSLAIRHAIRTGELAVREQVSWLDASRRDRWTSLIDVALRPGAHPRDYTEQNGWVVRAFQAALAAVAGAKPGTNAFNESASANSTSEKPATTHPNPHPSRPETVDALERAVRGGNDTDTVAAIAGSLAGALWGATQVPLSWKRILHGWPNRPGNGADSADQSGDGTNTGDTNANDLTDLAFLAVNGGKSPDREGWPKVSRLSTSGFLHTPARPHPHDSGVWMGSLSALDELPAQIDAVVSLSRVGSAQVPKGIESIRVQLIDQPGHNANLDHVLADTVDTIAQLRSEGKQVFFHCAEARSRTAAIAALYAIRHRGIPTHQAWQEVNAALPYFNPAAEFREAVNRIGAEKSGYAPSKH